MPFYDLSTSGPRRLGLKRDSRVQGPHAHKFDGENGQRKNVVTAKQEEIDIEALPQDSSEEEPAPIFQAEDYGEASATSDSDVQRKPRSSLPNSTSPSHALPRGSPWQLHRSKSDETREEQSQVTGRKRKAEQISDDETGQNISFQMRIRKGGAVYGKNKAKPQSKNRSGSQEWRKYEDSNGTGSFSRAKEEISAFKRPPTDGPLAEREPSSPPVLPNLF